jgi:hypothetical protein
MAKGAERGVVLLRARARAWAGVWALVKQRPVMVVAEEKDGAKKNKRSKKATQ